MPSVRPSRHRRTPRLRALALAAATWLAAAAAGAQSPEAAATSQKVLRYAMSVAETGFDPAQVADAYSREIIDNIIEPPLRYDLLARPLRLRTATAAALPET